MFKTILTGNLGNDAEVRETNSGMCAIGFSVAHTEKWKNQQGVQQEKTVWVKCTLWRQNDKRGVAEFLKKGMKVLVEGQCEARAWNDQQGQARCQLELRVLNLEFLSKAPEGSGQSSGQQNQPAQQNENPFQNGPTDNDDLPF